MEIILLERIGKLGNIGDTVKVKDGYARNFLFPGKKALKATKENKLIVDQKRQKLLEKDKKSLEEAKEISKKLSDTTILIKVETDESSKLYGSVSLQDIMKELSKKSSNIEKKHIQLSNPLKEVGDYDINIRPHPDVLFSVKVKVESKGGKESK